MKTDIGFLPENKQQELHTVTTVVQQLVSPKMIILFGSYARGNWVEEFAEDGIHLQYQSDYDLLIIVNTRNIAQQRRLEGDIMAAIENIPEIKTPVSPIVHDIEFLNKRLEEGQYFFSDIKKQGILLYNPDQLTLREPRELSNKERYHLAKEDFNHWFPTTKTFFRLYELSFKETLYNEAAFILHQVTEKLYTTLLLVFTRYKPKMHDLKILRRLTNTLDHRLIKIFPMSDSEERRLFTLLRDAYVDARYKKNYSIAESELSWLEIRVTELQKLTEILCQEKIASFLNE